MARFDSHRAVNALLVVAAVALIATEIIRPLRRRAHEPKFRRMTRNAVIGGLAAATVQIAEHPLVVPVARATERSRIGLLPRLPLPPWLKTVLALVALDYTLYVWHVLVHRVPALWRFHAIHHADLDLDASTAIRFHAGELLASVPWRAAQVAIIGVPPHTLALWQSLTLLSVLFHHSNARLPVQVERALGIVFVTPRMHGIHHSRRLRERDSNWSSGLAVWDRLHGTLCLDAEDEVPIGVDGYDTPDDVALRRLITRPVLESLPSDHPDPAL